MPVEAVVCEWGGGKFHPDNMRQCSLSGITHHQRFAERERLKPLVTLLDGTSRRADATQMWDAIAVALKQLLGGRCTVDATEVSPQGDKLAVAVQVKRMLGFKTEYAGFVYSIERHRILGRPVVGERAGKHWAETRGVKAA